MPEHRKAPVTRQAWVAGLRIMRPWNLVMIAASMAVFAWKVVGTALQDHLWAVVVMVSMAAAGNVINDYFDQREDRVNKPRRALVGRVLKRRVALAEHGALTVLALCAAGWGSWKMQVGWPLLWTTVLGGALAAYSPWFKRHFLRGNVLIALAVGQLPLWTGAVLEVREEQAWVVLIGFAFISGWLTLVREVTKDLQDAEGDAQWGYDTLPIRWGRERTLRALNGLFAVSAIWLVLASGWWWSQIEFGASATLLFWLPFAAGWRELRRGREDRVSAWLKLTLAGGLAALVAAVPLA